MARAGRYYSESEYDLTPLKSSGRRLLELGRSCVHRDHRGGTAMVLLWNALADYVLDRGIEVMFGMASFHGTDAQALAQPLSYLHHHHLAPHALRVRARAGQRQEMNLIPANTLDRRAAMAGTPTFPATVNQSEQPTAPLSAQRVAHQLPESLRRRGVRALARHHPPGLEAAEHHGGRVRRGARDGLGSGEAPAGQCRRRGSMPPWRCSKR